MKSNRKLNPRTVSFAALVLVLIVLVAQVLGVRDLEAKVDSTSLLLLLLAIVLAVAWIAPSSIHEMLDRVSFLKLPGVELQMEAAGRAERIDSWLPADEDAVTTKARPRGGGSMREYDVVRDKLEERLRSVAKYLLGKSRNTDRERIVSELAHRELLTVDELHLVRDLLGDIEEEMEKMPADVRSRYLDAGWRFAMRFRTLVFERLARREMTNAGWLVFDFEQARSHRPDFLAFKDGGWLLIATRYMPNSTKATRRRLTNMTAPFDAKVVVVSPDSRTYNPEEDDEYSGISVWPLKTALGGGPVPAGK